MARILLIDDDIDVSEELKETLIDLGHSVEAVYSGPEALEHLEFCEYDLVLMDWLLPGKNGVDVCREYRTRGGTTPVMMLTGKTAEDALDECKRAGADDFLEKPFSLELLEVRVNILLCQSSVMAC